MKKFTVVAYIEGLYNPNIFVFNSRNTAYRFIKENASMMEGGEWFVNGRCKSAIGSRKRARQFWFN